MPAKNTPTHFTFRNLEVFVSVMMSGSATRAAHDLGMTQPNVSKTIKLMEQRLGVSLFERMQGRLRPTPEAEKLFKQAQLLRHEVTNFTRYAMRIGSEGVGLLRISTLPVFSNQVLPDAAASFMKSYPNVEIGLEISREDLILESVARGTADLGLIHFPQYEVGNSIKLETIGSRPMTCAVPLEHPLAKRKMIKPEDLIGETFISFPEFLAFRQAIDEALGKHVDSVSPQIIVNHSALAYELVARGVGIAMADQFSVSKFAEHIKLVPFRNAPRIAVGLVSQPARPLSMLAAEFRLHLIRAIEQGE